MTPTKSCENYFPKKFLVGPSFISNLGDWCVSNDLHLGLEGQTPSAGAIILAKEMDNGENPIVRKYLRSPTLPFHTRYFTGLWCIFNTASMAIAYASSDNPQPKVWSVLFLSTHLDDV